ncbi:ABC-type transporter, integral membrane subunit [Caldalkalibacillus thermarum TA2.A1]|uniref:ABC transporter permease n=1 Tax=Caldalkalibacillus thermarum (strain TA2.A1) TaxID=986075 RepID=F5L9V9_CALTT|nr:oligopeptide ABC transporter permease [Caldalkalibacillus thermarum]EGL81829.1 ABC-type transporter, integral membrane subunit [Caldalkalibacillus thermarum TA2.A1]QZT34319.1 ABC transporter permease [Caldalkalibacillus thermarum TA2.A1]
MSQVHHQLPTAQTPAAPEAVTIGERRSLWSIMLAKFFQNKLAVVGLVCLVIIILAVIFAPYLTPYEPHKQDLANRLQPPSKEHLMGTDHVGRDIFTRVLYGGRVSLMVGFSAMAIMITIGTLVGAIAGYYGGRIDAILMRTVDVLISFPSIFLLITLVAFLQPGLTTIIFVLAVFGWMGTARLVRGEFLTLKQREFVLAARTTGMSNLRIIFTQILPNAMGPIIVAATLGVGSIIITESTLSFLGLGVQPPTPSWGNMLTDAQSVTIFRTAWWYPTFPGLMILMTVLAFNFVGDGLRDALDPRVIEK